MSCEVAHPYGLMTGGFIPADIRADYGTMIDGHASHLVRLRAELARELRRVWQGGTRVLPRVTKKRRDIGQRYLGLVADATRSRSEALEHVVAGPDKAAAEFARRTISFLNDNAGTMSRSIMVLTGPNLAGTLSRATRLVPVPDVPTG